MKVKGKPLHVWLLFIALLSLVVYLIYRCAVADREATAKSMEKAYFLGQQGAINGDIRIAKDSIGKWKWLKSPWEDGRRPSYIP